MRCARCGRDEPRGQTVFGERGLEDVCDACAKYLPRPPALGGA